MTFDWAIPAFDDSEIRFDTSVARNSEDEIKVAECDQTMMGVIFMSNYEFSELGKSNSFERNNP